MCTKYHVCDVGCPLAKEVANPRLFPGFMLFCDAALALILKSVSYIQWCRRGRLGGRSCDLMWTQPPKFTFFGIKSIYDSLFCYERLF